MKFRVGDLICFKESSNDRIAIITEVRTRNGETAIDYIYCDQKTKSWDDADGFMPACYMADFEKNITKIISNFANVEITEYRQGDAVEDESITVTTITAGGETYTLRTWFWDVNKGNLTASPGFYDFVKNAASK